ncbi:hypothetical protein QL285_008712 [Trifolium repens]|nr:hypothetical protein QL285_008712 [Trifolium repens]
MGKSDNKQCVAGRPKTRPAKKKNGASSSKAPPGKAARQAKAKNAPVLPSSSSSEDIDEDYAEFLKTYVPEEFLDYGPSFSVDEGSQVTTEASAKAPKSSKVQASKLRSS